MNKNKRKSMSLRNRFRVFKRDQFTCQYCMRSTPIVTLEVDHIVPVSRGGDNSQDNLITACYECNRGKYNEPLDAISQPVQERLKEEILLRKERQKQIAYLDKELRKLKEAEQEIISDIGIHWWNNWVEDSEKDNTIWKRGCKQETSIKTFLKHLTPEQIKEAIDITISNGMNNEYYAFKYFCGVCWKIIKGGTNV